MPETQYNLPLHHWLRNRPATVDALEDVAGYTSWNHLDDTLTGFCKVMGIKVSDLHVRLAGMALGTDNEDWLSKPLFLLIDHLTVNHEIFREHDLPKMECLLGNLKLELGMVPAPAVEALADFQSFRREFIWHMEEEESFLFPKIMRAEACLHHPDLYPEIFKGSVAMFPPALIRRPDQELQEMLSALILKVRKLPLAPVHSQHSEVVLSNLLSFAAKLKVHAYLESGILFRRAMEMETELLKRSVHSQSFDNAQT